MTALSQGLLEGKRGRWVICAHSRPMRMAGALEAIADVEEHPVLVITEPEHVISWLQRLNSVRAGHTHRLDAMAFADASRWRRPWLPVVAPSPALFVVGIADVPWTDTADAAFGAVVVDVSGQNVLDIASAVADVPTQQLLVLTSDARVATTAAALSGAAFRDLDRRWRLPAALRARLQERVVPWTETDLALLKLIEQTRRNALPALESALRISPAAFWDAATQLFATSDPSFHWSLEELLSTSGEPTFDAVFDVLDEHETVAVCVSSDVAAGDLEQVLDDNDVASVRSAGGDMWETVAATARSAARVFILPDSSLPDACPPVECVVHLDVPSEARLLVDRMEKVDRAVGEVPHHVIVRPQADIPLLTVLGFH